MPSPAQPEPRWAAIVAVLAVGGLYLALPDYLAIGPRWLLLVIIAIMVAAAAAAHYLGSRMLNIVLGLVITCVITLFMIGSVALLVAALPAHKEPPVALLRSAAILWVTNVLVFAHWYWRLDAGGPHGREQRLGHPTGAFFFPQMALGERARCEPDGTPWTPRFLDYLFLAFNTSTALSPTDTPVLSRWAKLLVMIQAVISLTIVAILIGRAINML